MAQTIDPWADPFLIVAAAQDAVIGQALDGTIASWNAGAERLLGYTAADALGRPAAMLAATPGPRDWAAAVERIRRGDRIAPYEDVFRRNDEYFVPVSVALSPVLDRVGQLLGLSQIARPVTALDSIDAALRGTDPGRAGLRGELRQLFRLGAMGQMATALAHELNQPLTAIASYLTAARQLLRMGGTGNVPALMTTIDRTYEQVNRTAWVIHRLRSFVSRDDDGHEPASIAAAIMDASELVLIAARQAGVTASFQLDADAIVSMDRLQIEQVVFTLMRNAVEAMEGASSREFRVSTALSGEFVIVSVADTRPDLPPEGTARLHQPAGTIQAGTIRPDGVGVGLPICQAIIAAHGGELRVDPDMSRGTTFHFKLPVVPPGTAG